MEWLGKIDKNILISIQENIRTERKTRIMKTITFLGDGGWFWIVLAFYFLAMKKTRKAGFCVLGALILGAITTNIVLKPLLKRPRPYDVSKNLERLIPAQEDWSFPSGHTTASFAASGVVYLVVSEKWGAATMALATTIAYSRMYLGVHYLSDVMAGVSVGLGSALIVDEIVKRKSNAK